MTKTTTVQVTPCDPDEPCQDERFCGIHFEEEAARYSWMRSYYSAELNPSGHRYGCDCDGCMDYYQRALKR